MKRLLKIEIDCCKKCPYSREIDSFSRFCALAFREIKNADISISDFFPSWCPLEKKSKALTDYSFVYPMKCSKHNCHKNTCYHYKKHERFECEGDDNNGCPSCEPLEE